MVRWAEMSTLAAAAWLPVPAGSAHQAPMHLPSPRMRAYMDDGLQFPNVCKSLFVQRVSTWQRQQGCRWRLVPPTWR